MDPASRPSAVPDTEAWFGMRLSSVCVIPDRQQESAPREVAQVLQRCPGAPAGSSSAAAAHTDRRPSLPGSKFSYANAAAALLPLRIS